MLRFSFKESNTITMLSVLPRFRFLEDDLLGLVQASFNVLAILTFSPHEATGNVPLPSFQLFLIHTPNNFSLSLLDYLEFLSPHFS